MSLVFHSLRISSLRREADALVLGFDVPDSLRQQFAFTAGQHLTLRALVGGQDLRRSYSICSGQDDGALCVAIRLVPAGAFSGWAAATLQLGTALEVLPPQGRFVLPEHPPGPNHRYAHPSTRRGSKYVVS